MYTMERKVDKYFADFFTPILVVLYEMYRMKSETRKKLYENSIQETTSKMAQIRYDENRLRDEFSYVFQRKFMEFLTCDSVDEAILYTNIGNVWILLCETNCFWCEVEDV